MLVLALDLLIKILPRRRRVSEAIRYAWLDVLVLIALTVREDDDEIATLVIEGHSADVTAICYRDRFLRPPSSPGLCSLDSRSVVFL